MQKSLPSQAEILSWMSVFLTEKLNQAAQNKDWTGVAAISKIINAVTECLQEVKK